MSLNLSSFSPGCLLRLSKDKWQSVWSLTTPLTRVVDDIESLTRFLSFLEHVSVIVFISQHTVCLMLVDQIIQCQYLGIKNIIEILIQLINVCWFPAVYKALGFLCCGLSTSCLLYSTTFHSFICPINIYHLDT